MVATVWFTPEELAERWKLDPQTLKQWRMRKKGPAYMRTDKRKRTGRVRYNINDIIEYEQKNMVNSKK